MPNREIRARVPEELRAALVRDATRTGMTVSGVLRAILYGHYATRPEDIWKKLAAASKDSTFMNST